MAGHVDDALLKNPPFPLTTIDRELLSMKDEDFKRIEWQDLQRIIVNNTLEELKRLPSDLRRYLVWSYETKKTFKSTTSFVMQERLHWTPKHDETLPITATSFDHHSSTPFEDSRDYTILKNDWPYGFADDITHIVVWSRTPIAVDHDKGDVTPESRALIEEFVEMVFVDALSKDERIDKQLAACRVMWFKNWECIISITRSLDFNAGPYLTSPHISSHVSECCVHPAKYQIDRMVAQHERRRGSLFSLACFDFSSAVGLQ